MRAPHVIALTREIISMGIHSLDSFGVRRTISVGGIEAASAILGEPISMVIPEVVGCKLTGKLQTGVTCTDLQTS